MLMKNYATQNIRNIGFIGHGGEGKTTLTEAMLYNAKAIERLGRVEDGNTTTDYDPEEIKRKISISAAVAPLEWNEHKINIIDVPGYFDFIGEMIEALRVVDGAVIVVGAVSGVIVGTEKEVNGIEQILKKLGLGVHISIGSERTIIGVIGDKRLLADTPLELMHGVDRIVPIVEPFKLVGKIFKPESSIIDIKDVAVGNKKLVMIAGPCAVESHEQIMKTAKYLKSKGVQFLRGGAYKPRTSPYSFQGLEEKGYQLLAEARSETGLLIVSEIVSIASIEQAAKYVDVFQIGARNMQNFQLLREVGRPSNSIKIIDVLLAGDGIAHSKTGQTIHFRKSS
jgi:small GTP-binding protein